jgi:DNA polymerase III, gamma/tau subunits
MMKNMTWKNLVGQERVKEVMTNAFAHETLGHAYLFCGDEGTGKFQAALELSMALLCSNGASVPCYECDSCAKVLRYAHPDFHVIMPVSLEKEHKAKDGKLSAEGWSYLTSCVQEKITRPYESERSRVVPSIPVEWVKEVNHTILRGALSAGKNITLIDGVDSMNKESANAMLKTLEEPPADTLLVLMTSRPQSVLPTIVSRCQILRFGAVPAPVIKKAMTERFGAAGVPGPVIDEAVRFSMGSPGRALYLCENPSGELAGEAGHLLDLCVKGNWQDIAVCVDELARQADLDRHERLFMYMAYGVRGSFLRNMPGSATYIDTQDFSMADANQEILPIADTYSFQRVLKACQDAIAALRSYGNVSLVFVHYILTLMEIIHGKKQQIS